MFLPRINANLYAAGRGAKNPGEGATTHVGFKSTVPKSRSGSIDILRCVGEAYGIVPDTARDTDLMVLDEELGEWNRIR